MTIDSRNDIIHQLYESILVHLVLNPMDTRTDNLQLNVGFIAQESIGYSRDFIFGLPTLSPLPDLELRNLEGKVQVSRTSEGLLFRGQFQAYTAAICSRCLCDFDQLLKTDFTELYTFASHATDDTELVYPENGQVEFGPVVWEYLLLETPINPVCRPDCKGLCSICGNDLNIEVCNHEPDTIDPRLSVLKGLLDEK